MNILNIIDIPWYSGVTSYAIESSKGLSKKGHKIFFAGVKNGLPLKVAGENGFETLVICSRKNPFILKSVLKLKDLIQNKKIDIVNAHTGKGHFLAYLASIFSKNKFAIVRTKADDMYPKRSFLSAKTDKIIAASELIKKRYIEIKTNPEKIAIIYQGIEIPVLSEYPAPEGPIIGMVGRLDPVKGHKYFLEAAAFVLKRFSNAKFLIAGKEENIKYEELKVFAGKLGIEKNIQFVGYVDNVYKFMSGCTIGVIASTGSEAVSRVLLEWMSCGKPVVATSVGCIPEILGKEFLSEPCDSEILTKNILYFLEKPGNIKITGENNRKIIKEKYNIDKFISETEKAYNETIKNIAH
ncbi:MAG: hypothetical protein A2539_06630 [Elusimicrobia bacterium RIFOXYD2_FULL_34_15]|nr:MAG: hypothetical protein A2539_06630 [Elusimicrobia bacterium RIFOXYD2_FULL_34_15]